MRITSEMMITSSLQRLSTRLQRYEQAQSRLATGRRINTPSDDPAGTSQALALRAVQRSREQELRNAGDARSRLDLTDSTLQAANDRLARARDLLVRGATEASPSEREAIALELEAVQAELHTIANGREGGTPLFAGYGKDDPVVLVEDPGPPPTRTWTYTGDDGAVLRRVGDQDVVRVNATATEAFGIGIGDGGVFAVLDDAVAALRAGDLGAVSGHLDDIDTARDRIGSQQARVGATRNWVDSAARRADDSLLALRGQLAEVEDVDFAEAVMNLQVEEVAFEATLQALGRALPASLGAFLR